jgi:hypothetical protein
MANRKISELNATAQLPGNTLIPVVVGGANYSSTMTVLSNTMARSLTSVYSVSQIFGPTFEYVLVAGGGGGGGALLGNSNLYTGGGGAGGTLSGTFIPTNNDVYTITIGAGGIGTTGNTGTTAQSRGQNTQITGITVPTAIGGGAGIGGANLSQSFLNDGGSGGGAYNNSTAKGFGTVGQGNNGYSGGNGHGGGGGGKAFLANPNFVTPIGQDGITVFGTWGVGGGGAGGTSNFPAAGGLGGGGIGGSPYNPFVGGNGGENQGGGGGGAASQFSTTPLSATAGGNGGSGVAIFKYPSNWSMTITPSTTATFETTVAGSIKYTRIKSSCQATFTQV